MDKELDAVFDPHAPFPLSNMWHRYEFEVDPIRVNPFVDADVRFDPVAIDVARIWLSVQKLPPMLISSMPAVQNASDSGAKPLQRPSTPRGEAKASRYCIQSCLIIAGR